MHDNFLLVNRENFTILAYWYYFWCKCGQKEIVKYMEWKKHVVCVGSILNEYDKWVTSIKSHMNVYLY